MRDFTQEVVLYFLQNHSRTAMRHLKLTAQGVMGVTFYSPFTVWVSNFVDRPVSLPRHTVLGIAPPSSAHNVTVGSASPGLAKVQKRGENVNERTPNKGEAKTWEDEIHVGLDDDNVRREVLRLLTEAQDM